MKWENLIDISSLEIHESSKIQQYHVENEELFQRHLINVQWTLQNGRTENGKGPKWKKRRKMFAILIHIRIQLYFHQEINLGIDISLKTYLNVTFEN